MTTIQQPTTTLTDLVGLKFTEAPRRPPISVVRTAHCGCFPGLQQPIGTNCSYCGEPVVRWSFPAPQRSVALLQVTTRWYGHARRV